MRAPTECPTCGSEDVSAPDRYGVADCHTCGEQIVKGEDWGMVDDDHDPWGGLNPLGCCTDHTTGGGVPSHGGPGCVWPGGQ